MDPLTPSRIVNRCTEGCGLAHSLGHGSCQQEEVLSYPGSSSSQAGKHAGRCALSAFSQSPQLTPPPPMPVRRTASLRRRERPPHGLCTPRSRSFDSEATSTWGKRSAGQRQGSGSLPAVRNLMPRLEAAESAWPDLDSLLCTETEVELIAESQGASALPHAPATPPAPACHIQRVPSLAQWMTSVHGSSTDLTTLESMPPRSAAKTRPTCKAAPRKVSPEPSVLDKLWAQIRHSDGYDSDCSIDFAYKGARTISEGSDTHRYSSDEGIEAGMVLPVSPFSAVTSPFSAVAPDYGLVSCGMVCD